MTLDGVSVQDMNKRVEEIAQKLNIIDILSKERLKYQGTSSKEHCSCDRS